jgi:predicted transcriptional regulator
MIRKKRSKFEIYLDVLRMVNSGVNKPTNIMYKCNLAWNPFKRILNSLVENGMLITLDSGSRRTYELTEKGREVLKYFKTTEAILVSLTRSRRFK